MTRTEPRLLLLLAAVVISATSATARAQAPREYFDRMRSTQPRQYFGVGTTPPVYRAPYQRAPARSGLSPYLYLSTPNNLGYEGINYYTIVRPMQRYQADIRRQQYEINRLQRQVDYLGAELDSSRVPQGPYRYRSSR